jgi:SH3 domain protein
MKRLMCFGLLCIASFVASGQTRYISDELVITFRTGPSSQNAITRNLSSGARVEVLEELADEGYSRVRLADGAEGWVLTRYLQVDPTASQRLATAERQLADALARANSLEQQVQMLEAELAATGQALSETESNVNRTSAELADIRRAAASALETREQNESLRLRVAELTSVADLAELEIDELSRRERQNWFIVGAAVLFGGIIIGLIAPSLRPKRKSSW